MACINNYEIALKHIFRPKFKIYVLDLHISLGLQFQHKHTNRLNVMHICQTYINET